MTDSFPHPGESLTLNNPWHEEGCQIGGVIVIPISSYPTQYARNKRRIRAKHHRQTKSTGEDVADAFGRCRNLLLPYACCPLAVLPQLGSAPWRHIADEKAHSSVSAAPPPPPFFSPLTLLLPLQHFHPLRYWPMQRWRKRESACPPAGALPSS